MNDDFYIGYLPRTSPGLARFVRRRVLLLLCLGALVPLLLVSTMSGFSRASFEFGVEREFEGTLRGGAVPLLLVDRPGGGGTSSYLLSAFGKFGAAHELDGLEGSRVRLRGTLVHRDDRTMIEVAADSVERSGPGATSPADIHHGEVTLEGEIVDSKCYLGVMKPGNLKPHRACAVRCISGGIPPVLLVRDEEGRATYHLLVDPEGRAVNRRVLHLVAEPVRATGLLVERAGQLFLHVDPERIERL